MDRVEVPGQSTTAGTTLDQWQANGGTSQEWTFCQPGEPWPGRRVLG